MILLITDLLTDGFLIIKILKHSRKARKSTAIGTIKKQAYISPWSKCTYDGVRLSFGAILPTRSGEIM